MERDSKPRAGPRQPRPRRLRDISHLYLTKESRQQPSPAQSPAPPRRMLRLAFASNGDRLAKTDVCSNMAVQLARLGQRTTVLDLDPILPNAGFHLGLAPSAYMAHLQPGARPSLERGVLGMRILEGVADAPELILDEALQQEITAADCVVLNLPAPHAAAASLERLRAVLRAPSRTTMARVGARSRMFGDWLQGARGASRPEHATAPVGATPGELLDTLVFVRGASTAEEENASLDAFRSVLPAERVRVVAWGDAAANLQPPPWACIRSYPLGLAARHPLSSLYPEHPAARMYQNLAQSLLAGFGSSGGARG